MTQHSNYIAGQYDSMATEYAEAFRGEHDRKPKDGEMLHRFAREIGNREPVWDFGCGPGHTAQYLKNLGVNISGLDVSDKMVEQARMIHPDIRFRRDDLLALDFENGSIAGAVAFYAIVHFTKEQAKIAFREIFRVLRPGGILLTTFHIGDETIHVDEFLGKKIGIDFMFFTTDFISGCLNSIGFEGVEKIERDPYPGVEYQSRRAYMFSKRPCG